MITADLASRKICAGRAVMFSCRNQPDRRSSASWAPPLIAAPSDPYAAIETMIIAAQLIPSGPPASPYVWVKIT
jgi:hypothetical protein